MNGRHNTETTNKIHIRIQYIAQLWTPRKQKARKRYYTVPPKEMSADLSWLSTRAVAWYDNRIGTKRTARKWRNLNMAEVSCQYSRAIDLTFD